MQEHKHTPAHMGVWQPPPDNRAAPHEHQDVT